MSEPNLKKFSTQIKFVDAQAEFVHEARAALTVPMSGTAFCEMACLQAAASVLGRPAPERSTPKRAITFGVAGSRVPEAKALGLTTHEYKRRIKVLALAGLEPTNDNVARVPAAPKRAKKAA
jgi:hypothetical protein